MSVASGISLLIFSRPLRGLVIHSHRIPSDESLGYSQTCALRTPRVAGPQSAVSLRMKIARRFIGGIEWSFFSRVRKTDG